MVRAPLAVFNERVLCGIGKDIATTGMLSPDGVELAIPVIHRFVTICRELDAGQPIAVATAAVREALDGAEFIKRIGRESGLPVRILSGTEEGRLAAFGVKAALPQAHGVMGDLGGGSLELVNLRYGEIEHSITLPLGTLRLLGLSAREIKSVIDSELDSVPWLSSLEPCIFYAVGGAWRSLARVHMDKKNYPLRIVHQYKIACKEAITFAQGISEMGAGSLAQIKNVNKARANSLPGAAMIYSEILRRTQPDNIMFLAGGLREGLIYKSLPNHIGKEDPLLSQCRDIAGREARFGDISDELFSWMAPVVSSETHTRKRLIYAVCILCDIFWRGHPSYRAKQAFEKILYAPLLGVDHLGRAFIALAIYVRYAGSVKSLDTAPARSIMKAELIELAELLGMVLRFGLTLSGGAPNVLSRTLFDIQGPHLKLVVNGKDSDLCSHLIYERLKKVGSLLGLAVQISHVDLAEDIVNL